jgi:hypothetical protein
MALYLDGGLLQRSQSPDNVAEFRKIYRPGEHTPWSGIYRCTGCGHEVVHTNGHPLPSQNHSSHASGLPPIRWQLVVTDLAGS